MSWNVSAALTSLLALLCFGCYWLLSFDASLVAQHHWVLVTLFWGAFILLFAAGAQVWRRRRIARPASGTPPAHEALALQHETEPTASSRKRGRIANWVGLAGLASTASFGVLIALQTQLGTSNSDLAGAILILTGFVLFCAAGLLGSRWWLILPAGEAGFLWYILANLRIGW
jgi:hypothetical protein